MDPPQRLAGALGMRLALGLDAGVGPRVHVGLDRDPHVRALDLGAPERADPAELRVGSVAEEQLGGALDVEAQVRMAAGREHAPPELVDERRGRRAGVDADEVAGADPRRVVDEDARQPLEPRRRR